MGRWRNERAGSIYRNCDKIAELNNEIRRLRAENIRLEWLEELDKGRQVTFQEFKSQVIYPSHWRRQEPPKAA